MLRSTPVHVLLALALTLSGAFCGHLHAQSSDTITPNPNAIKLRRIWTLVGAYEQAMMGVGGGSVGDVNSDSIADIAYYYLPGLQWRVCFGAYPAPDTAVQWISSTEDSLTPAITHPVVGDFWGKGNRGVVFSAASKAPSDYWFQLAAYRLDSTGHLPERPTIRSPTGSYSCQKGLIAADLDNDGADELILPFSCEGIYLTTIRIYKGGPAFQLDSPSVVIDDGQGNTIGDFIVAVADLDGDGRLDILTGATYGVAGPKLKVWLGATGSIWRNGPPDRTIALTDSLSDHYFTLLNVDNDGRADLLRGLNFAPKFGDYLFVSSQGGSIVERSLSVDSADRRWAQSGRYGTMGYLIDSTHRYEGTQLFINDPSFHSGRMLVLGGGKLGPNNRYDAYYLPRLDGLEDESVFGNASTQIPDCNADGWPDYFAGDISYKSFYTGIALVLAGGPYIPRDDSNAAVRDIAVTGLRRALSIWPNPARDVVNIAWRGDLHPMPRRFEIHSLIGRLVAHGTVDPGRGAAIWNCAAVASGMYLLSAFDADGALIATMTLLKE